MSELASTIENVYLAFADAPKPESIGACPCCIDDATLDRLVTLPLREVSDEDLSPYASSAFLTAGNVDDYLYFLPRILEVTIVNDTWLPQIEVTGRAIRESRRSEWPAPYRQAVQELFEAVFESFLAEKYYYRVDEWICGAARAGFDVTPLLGIVERSDEAILEILQFELWSPPPEGWETHFGRIQTRDRRLFWNGSCPITSDVFRLKLTATRFSNEI